MLYMARFSFDQRQEGKDNHVGSFEVLLEAATVEAAADACKGYLTKLVRKEKRDAFAGNVVLYLDDLFEIEPPLSKPALINFRAQRADGFSEIMNAMLDGAPQVTPYGWGDPEKPDELEPFMSFESAPAGLRKDGREKSKSVSKSKSKSKSSPKKSR